MKRTIIIVAAIAPVVIGALTGVWPLVIAVGAVDLIAVGAATGIWAMSADPRPMILVWGDLPIVVVGPRGFRQSDLDHVAREWWLREDGSDLLDHLLDRDGFRLPTPLEVLGIDERDPNSVVPVAQLRGTTGSRGQ